MNNEFLKSVSDGSVLKRTERSDINKYSICNLQFSILWLNWIRIRRNMEGGGTHREERLPALKLTSRCRETITEP
jgi:hypothetical protein